MFMYLTISQSDHLLPLSLPPSLPFTFPPQFNDILIYASSIPPANTTYKVVKRIPLEGMRVEHLDDPEMRYGFQIISTCKSFRLEARLAGAQKILFYYRVLPYF